MRKHSTAGVFSAVLAIAPLLLGPAVAAGEESGKAKPKQAAVAGVGDRKFTRQQLLLQFRLMPEFVLEPIRADRTGAAARKVAGEWYARLLFEADARPNGLYRRHRGVRGRADDLGRELIEETYLADMMATQFAPTEDELKQFFALNGERVCAKPARYRIARVGVVFGKHSSAAEREAAKERMQAMVDRLEAGTPFSEVANTSSDLSTGEDGGELGWATDRELGSTPDATAIKALEAGERSAIVEGESGLAVYTVLDKEGVQPRTLDECRTDLEEAFAKQFTREARRKRVNELAEKHGGFMNVDEVVRALQVAAQGAQ